MHKALSRILFMVLLGPAMEVCGQQPSVYTDVNQDFKKGLELFHQQKYESARHWFVEARQRLEQARPLTDHLLLLNATYYEGVCSKKLGRPDAEKILTDLVNNYERDPVTRRAFFELADIYYEQKKYDKLLTWLRRVTEADLNDAELNRYKFQSGVGYFYRKDFDKAITYFEETKQVQNEYYYPSQYYYGYITYKQVNLDAAWNAFRLAGGSEHYKNTVPYYLANIDYLRGNFDEIIKNADTLTAVSSGYRPEMLQLVGKAHFMKKQYMQALPYLSGYASTAIKLTKADWYQLGYSQYKTGHFPEAIESFNHIGVLNDSLGQQATYQLGICYLAANRLNEARLAFEKASQMNFDRVLQEESAFLFAKLSHDLNYHEGSAQALQQFLTSYPQSPRTEEVKSYLAAEFLATNNYRDALEVIRSVNGKSAEWRKAYQKVAYSRGTELFNEGDFSGTVNLMDESLKNPVDATLKSAAYFWKGESQYHLRNYVQAITDHDLFLSLAGSRYAGPSGISAAHSKYTQAYCYLEQENYAESLTHFRQAREGWGSTDEKVRNFYADATLRTGDCQFVLKNYTAASAAYDQVISGKYAGMDYAYYQKAVLGGLQGNNTMRISTLIKLTTEFPSSIYADDAWYELGIAYLSIPAYQDAEHAFLQVTSRFSSGSYALKSHLKLGLIYFNLDNARSALDQYKWVLDRYPKTPEGAEALNGVKEIFTGQGDAQGYLAFVQGLPNVNISEAIKDSVVYLAAEQKYLKGECSKAVLEFSSYLREYPSGVFSTQAHFYRGECLFRQNELSGALADYEFVAALPRNRFSEKALLQAARISYTEKKDYTQAYDYYSRLVENAEIKTNALEGYRGMMYSAWYLGQYEQTTKAAEGVLAQVGAGQVELTEAHFYLARCAQESGNLQKALEEYRVVYQATTSGMGAEAGYRLAEMHFKMGALTKAEDQAWNVIRKTPSHDYWIARSYLLLSDIFVVQKDWFQAQATLESIIENYKLDDDIIPEARKKLAQVKTREQEGSRLLEEDQIMLNDSIPENRQ